jgi:hypothetical protein
VIVHLSSDRPLEITDTARLDQLSARADGPIDALRLDPAWRLADSGHVWIAIDALRSAETGEAGAFDAMIAYAASKGWVDESGTFVRAHIETEAVE